MEGVKGSGFRAGSSRVGLSFTSSVLRYGLFGDTKANIAGFLTWGSGKACRIAWLRV